MFPTQITLQNKGFGARNFLGISPKLFAAHGGIYPYLCPPVLPRGQRLHEKSSNNLEKFGALFVASFMRTTRNMMRQHQGQICICNVGLCTKIPTSLSLEMGITSNSRNNLYLQLKLIAHGKRCVCGNIGLNGTIIVKENIMSGTEKGVMTKGSFHWRHL